MENIEVFLQAVMDSGKSFMINLPSPLDEFPHLVKSIQILKNAIALLMQPMRRVSSVAIALFSHITLGLLPIYLLFKVPAKKLFRIHNILGCC